MAGPPKLGSTTRIMGGVEKDGLSPSRLPDPCSAPWFVLLHGKKALKSQSFYSITARRFYVRSIQDMREHFCLITSFGWFLMLDHENRSFLWNPVTTARFELPSIPDDLFFYKCILSSPPTDPDCIVMFCELGKNYVMFCRPGDKMWICHHHDIAVCDVVSCRGKFYGITSDRELLIFDFEPEPRITILDITYPEPARLYTHTVALLESCGEIFLVDRFLMHCYNATGDIQVLKLDLSKQRWDEVDDIGDKVFFVNTPGCSVALLASDLGIKKGCIYFTECFDNHLYVYDLEEGTLSGSLACPNVKGISKRRPFFLMPPPAL